MQQFKFSLTHEVEGTLFVSDPGGWADSTIGFKRHADFFSLVEYFESAFSAYGSNGTEDGGRERLKNIETVYGPDALIEMLCEYSEDDQPFETVYDGTIPVGSFNEMLDDDHTIDFAITQKAFWTTFISRYETPVNIQSPTGLDGDAVDVIDPIVITLPSQIINRRTQYSGHSGNSDTMAEVTVATTANIVLSGLQTIDGISLIVGRRVLVKNQTDQTENGVYLVAMGAWTRASDANTDEELKLGIVHVKSGTVNAGKTYKQTTDPVTIGSSNIVWVEYNYVDDYLLFDHNDDGTVDITEVDFDIYITATVDPVQKEIEDSFTLIVGGVEDPADLAEQLEITDGFGELTISGSIVVGYDYDLLYQGTALIDDREHLIEWYVQVNEDTPILIDSFSVTNSVPESPPFEVTLSGTQILTVNLNDRVKTYVHIVIDTNFNSAIGDWEERKLYGGIISQEVNFDFKSQADPTPCEGFLLHDVARSVIDRTISSNDSLDSELLGGPASSPTYDYPGCAYKFLNAKFLQIRQYDLTDKPYFTSFKDWWNGANPVFNLALGYTDDNKIEITTKAAHFDDSEMSVLLSNVRKISRLYDKEHYFNAVETGYNQGKTEDISGIDDFQKTIRASIFKNIGKKLSLLSVFIAAPLAIEQARRTISTKSADYKFDDEVAIIALSEDGAGFTPELSENFTDVTGLNDEETKYNKRLTPARNFVRWMNYLNSGLQNYLSSVWKFVSGEGNYAMSATMDPDGCPGDYDGDPLAENQDIPVTDDYLFTPQAYTIDHYLTWEQYKAIRANRKKAIGISQTEANHAAFFIKELQFNIVTGDVKIIAWPKEPFNIQVIDDSETEHEIGPPPPVITEEEGIFDESFGYQFN